MRKRECPVILNQNVNIKDKNDNELNVYLWCGNKNYILGLI